MKAELELVIQCVAKKKSHLRIHEILLQVNLIERHHLEMPVQEHHRDRSEETFSLIMATQE